MKISQFKNEDAIDLLADIIEPATEIFSDSAVRDLLRGKDKTNAIKVVLKNHKKAIVEIFARLNNVPVEEYSCNIISLTKDLLDMLNDEEIMSVFTSAEQKMETTSSGSVTESTEA